MTSALLNLTLLCCQAIEEAARAAETKAHVEKAKGAEGARAAERGAPSLPIDISLEERFRAASESKVRACAAHEGILSRMHSCVRDHGSAGTAEPTTPYT